MMHLLMIPLWCTALLAQQVAEGPEPNSSTGTATVLPCGFEARGVLGSAADADWYRLVLVTTSDLRLETAPGAGAEIGDTTLTLLDGGGAPLRRNDNGVASAAYARLFARNLPAGTYYVAVESGALAASSGSYTLDVRCAAVATLPAPMIVAEGPENNDPRTGGTPTTIAPNARCNGVITTVGVGGDWDFYRVLLLTDSFVQVSVAATATHPVSPRLNDPVLYLFDGSTPPNQLAGPFHASDFGVYDAGLDVRLPAGVYQVAIRGLAGSTAGRYYLDVWRSDAARLTVNPGGCSGRTLAPLLSTVGPGSPQHLERPALGSTYSLLGQNLDSFGIVLHLVGFQPTLVDLTPFGAAGCSLYVIWADILAQLADAQGHANIVVPLPEAPSLLGATLESQLAVLDFSNPLGVTTSNSVSAVAGN